MLPLVASVYCSGLIFAASSFGADLVTEFASEMMIMAVFIVVIYAGALFDMWKSDSMSFSSHRPYKRFLKEKISDGFSCLHYKEYDDSTLQTAHNEDHVLAVEAAHKVAAAEAAAAEAAAAAAAATAVAAAAAAAAAAERERQAEAERERQAEAERQRQAEAEAERIEGMKAEEGKRRRRRRKPQDGGKKHEMEDAGNPAGAEDAEAENQAEAERIEEMHGGGVKKGRKSSRKGRREEEPATNCEKCGQALGEWGFCLSCHPRDDVAIEVAATGLF